MKIVAHNLQMQVDRRKQKKEKFFREKTSLSPTAYRVKKYDRPPVFDDGGKITLPFAFLQYPF